MYWKCPEPQVSTFKMFSLLTNTKLGLSTFSNHYLLNSASLYSFNYWSVVDYYKVTSFDPCHTEKGPFLKYPTGKVPPLPSGRPPKPLPQNTWPPSASGHVQEHGPIARQGGSQTGKLSNHNNNIIQSFIWAKLDDWWGLLETSNRNQIFFSFGHTIWFNYCCKFCCKKVFHKRWQKKASKTNVPPKL